LVYKLATVVSFAMAEPGRLMGNTPSNADLMDKDAEGEYEEEDAGLGHTPQADNHEGNTTDAEGSELDAEGEEIDDDDGEPVGAVKIAAPAEASSEDEDSDADGEAVDLSSDAKSTGDEASERSSSESEAENDWGNESEDGEESGAEPESSHNCTSVLLLNKHRVQNADMTQLLR
jgi:histone acetyltransferase SAS3